MRHFHLSPIAVLLLFFSCSKDQPIEPPPPSVTPDTTSHDYTFTTYYIGDGQTTLNDVFAINDTDVWAVGEIYLKDSTGKLDNTHPYNVAHWDGKAWDIFQIYSGGWVPSPLYSVFALNAKDVWVVSTVPSNWDGKTWKHYGKNQGYPGSGWLSKIWAQASNNIFYVGEKGLITHYDGQVFTRMESGTTQDLTDVYGNAEDVWAVGGEAFVDQGIVLKLQGVGFQEIDSLSNGNAWSIPSVWCTKKPWSNNGFVILAGGSGIRYRDTIWKEVPKQMTGAYLGLGDLYFSSVRATGRNNVFAVGDFGIVLHFNGASWKFYPRLFGYPRTYYFTSVSVMKEHVYIVGVDENRGIVIIGKEDKN